MDDDERFLQFAHRILRRAVTRSEPAFEVTGWAIFGDAVANILGESSAGVRAGDSGLHTTVRRMHCMRS